MDKSSPRPAERAFTLIEVVVVMAIIVWRTETLTFGPARPEVTFQDTTHPLGLKHWDPMQ